ncbi:MAG: helix-turn-helix transcriptional regulator [Acidithiobacillus sp.]
MRSEKYGDVKDVQQIVKRCRSEIYRLMKEENFPRQKKLGSKSLWDLEAVRQWLEAHLEEV